jgi:hypothetical protein
MTTLILIAIIGILNGEMDTIKTVPHKAWFKGWWIENNWKYENELVQWIMRFPLSFAKDGWHLLKSICMVLGAVAVWASPQVEWYYILIYIGVFGIFFNLSYHR